MKSKPLVRVIGIDDGFFYPQKKGKTILIGVVSRLDNKVEGIISAPIAVDALNASKIIASMINNSRFKKQVRFILLHGINFAGFNIADLKELNKKTSLPVIVCFKKNPDLKAIKRALKKFPDSQERIALIEGAPKINRLNSLFFQFFGCTKEEAVKVIRRLVLHSSLPEPLRLSHLIASGITKPVK